MNFLKGFRDTLRKKEKEQAVAPKTEELRILQQHLKEYCRKVGELQHKIENEGFSQRAEASSQSRNAPKSMFDALQNTSPTIPRARGQQRGTSGNSASNRGARGEYKLSGEDGFDSMALRYSAASVTTDRLAVIMKSFPRVGVKQLEDPALAKDMCQFLEASTRVFCTRLGVGEHMPEASSSLPRCSTNLRQFVIDRLLADKPPPTPTPSSSSSSSLARTVAPSSSGLLNAPAAPSLTTEHSSNGVDASSSSASPQATTRKRLGSWSKSPRNRDHLERRHRAHSQSQSRSRAGSDSSIGSVGSGAGGGGGGANESRSRASSMSNMEAAAATAEEKRPLTGAAVYSAQAFFDMVELVALGNGKRVDAMNEGRFASCLVRLLQIITSEPPAEAKAPEGSGDRSGTSSPSTTASKSTRNSASSLATDSAAAARQAAAAATQEASPLPPHEETLVARIVKILKALARHKSTTTELIRSNQLQTLFQMVQVGGQATGGVTPRAAGNASWRASAGPLQRTAAVPVRQLDSALSVLAALVKGKTGEVSALGTYVRRHSWIKALLVPLIHCKALSPNYIVRILSVMKDLVAQSCNYKEQSANLLLHFENTGGYDILTNVAFWIVDLVQLSRSLKNAERKSMREASQQKATSSSSSSRKSSPTKSTSTSKKSSRSGSRKKSKRSKDKEKGSPASGTSSGESTPSRKRSKEKAAAKAAAKAEDDKMMGGANEPLPSEVLADEEERFDAIRRLSSHRGSLYDSGYDTIDDCMERLFTVINELVFVGNEPLTQPPPPRTSSATNKGGSGEDGDGPTYEKAENRYLRRDSTGVGGIFSKLTKDSSSSKNNDDDIEGMRVRNINAFKVFQRIFVETKSTFARAEILNRILLVFSQHSDNFHLLHKLHAIAYFIEQVPKIGNELRRFVMKILEFVVAALNEVPFEEICALTQLLNVNQYSSSFSDRVDLVGIVLEVTTKFVNLKSNYKDVFRDTGMLEMLIFHIKQLAGYITDPSSDPKHRVVLRHAETYVCALECIQLLLDGNSQNIKVFRSSGGQSAMLTLVTSRQHRPPAMRVLSQHLDRENISDMLELLQTARDDFELQIALLQSFCHMFSEGAHVKDLWREIGGFSAVLYVLTKLDGLFTEEDFPRTSPDDDSKYADCDVDPRSYSSLEIDRKWTIIEWIIKCLSCALVAHPANRYHLWSMSRWESLSSGITLSGILKTPYALNMITSIFHLCTERQLARPSNISRPLEEKSKLGMSLIRNPQCVLLILQMLKELRESNNPGADMVTERTLAKLNQLSSLSVNNVPLYFNKEELASAGALSFFLRNFGEFLEVAPSKKSTSQQTLMERIQKQASYFVQGIGSHRLSPVEYKMLVRCLRTPQLLTTNLTRMLRAQPTCSYFEFQLTSTGYACIEVPTLGPDRSWPITTGYSLSFWLNVADDGGQAGLIRLFEFCSAANENLLRVVIKGGELTVVCRTRLAFPRIRFNPNRWYHVVLVHERGAVSKRNSELRVYIDSRLRHIEKWSVKESQPSAVNIRGYIGSPIHRTKKSSAIWRMGPMFFFDGILDVADIQQIFVSGAGYQGTFHKKRIQRARGPLLLASRTGVRERAESEVDSKMSDDIVAAALGHASPFNERASAVAPPQVIFSFQAHHAWTYTQLKTAEDMFDADAPHTNVSYGMTSSSAISGLRRGLSSLAHGMSLPSTGFSTPVSPRSMVSSPRSGLPRFPSINASAHSKSLGSVPSGFGRSGNDGRPRFALSSPSAIFNAANARRGSQNPSAPSGKKRDALSHITALAGVTDPGVIVSNGATSTPGADGPFGLLSGGVHCIKAVNLEDTTRTIGGVQALFPILARASTSHDVVSALELIGLMLYRNAKNLKEMSRVKGYSTIASFLQQKTHLLSMGALFALFAIAEGRSPQAFSMTQANTCDVLYYTHVTNEDDPIDPELTLRPVSRDQKASLSVAASVPSQGSASGQHVSFGANSHSAADLHADGGSGSGSGGTIGRRGFGRRSAATDERPPVASRTVKTMTVVPPSETNNRRTSLVITDQTTDDTTAQAAQHADLLSSGNSPPSSSSSSSSGKDRSRKPSRLPPPAPSSKNKEVSPSFLLSRDMINRNTERKVEPVSEPGLRRRGRTHSRDHAPDEDESGEEYTQRIDVRRPDVPSSNAQALSQRPPLSGNSNAVVVAPKTHSTRHHHHKRKGSDRRGHASAAVSVRILANFLLVKHVLFDYQIWSKAKPELQSALYRWLVLIVEESPSIQDMHTLQLPSLTSYTHAGLYPMQSRSSSKSKAKAATLGGSSRKPRALSRHKHSKSFSDYPYDPLRALNAPSSSSDKSGNTGGTVPVKPRSWNAHRLRQIDVYSNILHVLSHPNVPKDSYSALVGLIHVLVGDSLGRDDLLSISSYLSLGVGAKTEFIEVSPSGRFRLAEQSHAKKKSGHSPSQAGALSSSSKSPLDRSLAAARKIAPAAFARAQASRFSQGNRSSVGASENGSVPYELSDLSQSPQLFTIGRRRQKHVTSPLAMVDESEHFHGVHYVNFLLWTAESVISDRPEVEPAQPFDSAQPGSGESSVSGPKPKDDPDADRRIPDMEKMPIVHEVFPLTRAPSCASVHICLGFGALSAIYALVRRILALPVKVRAVDQVESLRLLEDILDVRWVSVFFENRVHALVVSRVLSLLCLLVVEDRPYELRFVAAQGYDTLRRLVPSCHPSQAVYYFLFGMLLAHYPKSLYKTPSFELPQFNLYTLKKDYLPLGLKKRRNIRHVLPIILDLIHNNVLRSSVDDACSATHAATAVDFLWILWRESEEVMTEFLNVPEHSDKLVKTLFIVAECLEEAAKQPKNASQHPHSSSSASSSQASSRTSSAKKSSTSSKKSSKKHKRSSSRDSTSSREGSGTHSRTRSHPQASSLLSSEDAAAAEATSSQRSQSVTPGLNPPPPSTSPLRTSPRTRQSPDGSVASSGRSSRRPPSSFAGLTPDLKPHNTSVAASIREKLAITLPKTSEANAQAIRMVGRSISTFFKDTIRHCIRAYSKCNSLMHRLIEAYPAKHSPQRVLQYQSKIVSDLSDSVHESLDAYLVLTNKTYLINLAVLCETVAEQLELGYQPSSNYETPETSVLYAIPLMNVVECVMSVLVLVSEINDKRANMTGREANGCNDVNTFETSLNRIRQSVHTILMCFLRQLQQKENLQQVDYKMTSLVKNSKVLFGPGTNSESFVLGLVYHMQRYILSEHEKTRRQAQEVWRCLLLYQMKNLSSYLVFTSENEEKFDLLSNGYSLLAESKYVDFEQWLEKGALRSVQRVYQMRVNPLWEVFLKGRDEELETILMKLLHRARDLQVKRVRALQLEQSATSRVALERRAYTEKLQHSELVRQAERRQVEFYRENQIYSGWNELQKKLQLESAIWDTYLPKARVPTRWMLDFTEGPHRMRKKLVRYDEFYTQYKIDLRAFEGRPDLREFLLERKHRRNSSSVAAPAHIEVLADAEADADAEAEKDEEATDANDTAVAVSEGAGAAVVDAEAPSDAPPASTGTDEGAASSSSPPPTGAAQPGAASVETEEETDASKESNKSEADISDAMKPPRMSLDMPRPIGPGPAVVSALEAADAVSVKLAPINPHSRSVSMSIPRSPLKTRSVPPMMPPGAAVADAFESRPVPIPELRHDASHMRLSSSNLAKILRRRVSMDAIDSDPPNASEESGMPETPKTLQRTDNNKASPFEFRRAKSFAHSRSASTTPSASSGGRESPSPYTRNQSYAAQSRDLLYESQYRTRRSRSRGNSANPENTPDDSNTSGLLSPLQGDASGSSGRQGELSSIPVENGDIVNSSQVVKSAGVVGASPDADRRRKDDAAAAKPGPVLTSEGSLSSISSGLEDEDADGGEDSAHNDDDEVGSPPESSPSRTSVLNSDADDEEFDVTEMRDHRRSMVVGVSSPKSTDEEDEERPEPSSELNGEDEHGSDGADDENEGESDGNDTRTSVVRFTEPLNSPSKSRPDQPGSLQESSPIQEATATPEGSSEGQDLSSHITKDNAPDLTPPSPEVQTRRRPESLSLPSASPSVSTIPSPMPHGPPILPKPAAICIAPPPSIKVPTSNSPAPPEKRVRALPRGSVTSDSGVVVTFVSSPPGQQPPLRTRMLLPDTPVARRSVSFVPTSDVSSPKVARAQSQSSSRQGKRSSGSSYSGSSLSPPTNEYSTSRPPSSSSRSTSSRKHHRKGEHSGRHARSKTQAYSPSLAERKRLSKVSPARSSSSSGSDSRHARSVSAAPTSSSGGAGGGDASVSKKLKQLSEEEEFFSNSERILRMLEPGDVVLPGSTHNCSRISGLNKYDGIVVMCQSNLYVIDGFYKDPSSGALLERPSHESTVDFQATVTYDLVDPEKDDDLTPVLKVTKVDHKNPKSPSYNNAILKKYRKASDPSPKHDPSDSSSSSKPDKSSVQETYREDTTKGSLMSQEGVDAYENDEAGMLDEEARLSRLKSNSQCEKWSYEYIREIHKRRYQLQSIGIEFFHTNGSNFLLVFESQLERDSVYGKVLNMNLSDRLKGVSTALSHADTLSSVESEQVRIKGLSKSMTTRWQQGEISNFAYLMFLNTLAGRSYNDLTQYPVFPWVLADYKSAELDLTKASTFRDLSKPMGAQTEPRASEFRARYDTWEDPEDKVPSFHYGTHYSSSAAVLYYLVRMEPFTKIALELQGGRFDHADRLFFSIPNCWELASATGGLSDVKELIPEFYYLPHFLENRNNFDFEKTQRKVRINDVQLPPWAHGSPQIFIEKHRQALESDYVSAHLHEWIDLIFGFKQRGKYAEEAQNVFYYLTYEDVLDIDKIEDEQEKLSVAAQINNFGQTPHQLFRRPHPQRKPKKDSVTIHSNPLLLRAEPFKQFAYPINSMYWNGDKMTAVEGDRILLPPHFKNYLSWGYSDHSLRFCSLVNMTNRSPDKVLSVHESIHDGPISCVMVTDDGQFVITGGVDSVVSVWSTSPPEVDSPTLSIEARLFGHQGAITALAASMEYRVLVSAGTDRQVIIWDLNRLAFVKRLPTHCAPISALTIDILNGTIVSCAATTVSVWDINGELLACTKTSDALSFTISSVSLARESDLSTDSLIVTGHQDGSLVFWELQCNEHFAQPLKSAATATADGTATATAGDRDPADSKSSPPSSGGGSGATSSGEPSMLDASSLVSSTAHLAQSQHSSSAPSSNKGVKSQRFAAGLASGRYGGSMEILTPIPMKKASSDVAAAIASAESSASSMLLRSSSTPSQRDLPQISYQELLRRASRCESPRSMLIGEESSAVVSDEALSSPAAPGLDPTAALPIHLVRTSMRLRQKHRTSAHDCDVVTIHTSSFTRTRMWSADSSGLILGWNIEQAADHWLKDSDVDNCQKCGLSFGYIERKHHCRSCGGIFCRFCSRNKIPLKRFGFNHPVRVCDFCYERRSKKKHRNKS